MLETAVGVVRTVKIIAWGQNERLLRFSSFFQHFERCWEG